MKDGLFEKKSKFFFSPNYPIFPTVTGNKEFVYALSATCINITIWLLSEPEWA